MQDFGSTFSPKEKALSLQRIFQLTFQHSPCKQDDTWWMGRGFRFFVQQKPVWIWVELPQCGPQYFFRKSPGPGGNEDVKTREEDDLGKVICGGTAPSMLQTVQPYIDPNTRSVLSNRSVVLLSLVAEGTEHRIPKSDQCIG